MSQSVSRPCSVSFSENSILLFLDHRAKHSAFGEVTSDPSTVKKRTPVLNDPFAAGMSMSIEQEHE